MKKLILALLVSVLLFSGCSSDKKETSESSIAETTKTYEQGLSEGYEQGYNEAKEEFYISDEELKRKKDDAYGEGYQDATEEYSGYIDFRGELIPEEDFIAYYAALCDTLGLPEYHEPWNEEDFLGQESYTNDDYIEESYTEDQVYWTPNGDCYHSSEYCRTLSRSKTIINGTIDEAINSGHGDSCDVCY